MGGIQAQLLDVREAAQLVRRSPETIRRWVWSGRLPAQRQGRKLLVARQDLLRLATGKAATALPLADWRKLARRHLRSTRGLPGSHGSAADLVLGDRRIRQSIDARNDASR